MAATVINVMRLDVIWELVSGHLETMCANKNEVMRAYGIQSMEKIICEALVYVSPTDGTADVNGTQDVGLALGSASEQVVNSKRISKEMQVRVLESVVQCFHSGRKDVQENAMNAVYDIIQNCGHVLREGWTVLLRLLSRVAKQHADLVPLGFKSVQLIADDFLGNLHLSNENWNKDMSNIDAGADDQDSKSTMNQDDELPSPARVDAFLLCIECLSDYAMQVADVNISLTAIGTLWAVGDYARQQMTQATNVECDSGKKANAIWIIVLKQLKILSLNERGPVRNCALQTMFTTLVTHGEFFSPKTWRACIDIEGFVFNVIDGIERKCTLGMNEDAVPSNTGNNGGNEEDNYMIVHHSRDTLAKQWNETRVIAMKELSRTVRSFFSQLSNLDFFGVVWAEMLNIIRHGILLNRDISNASEADVQREVVVASIAFASDLMIIASNSGSESITQTLWKPTWLTLCEFGTKEDFQYDEDEDLCRCLMRSLTSLWKNALEKSCISPLQTLDGQNMVLQFIQTVLLNRLKIEGRYKHSKSPAEREYMELIGEVILPNAVSGDNKALVEIIFDQLVKLASNEMSNPIFVMEAISTASDIRGKVVDGDEKILECLLNAASRGVSNGTSSLFESAAKHMLEFVLPSVDDARKTPNDDIWGVSKSNRTTTTCRQKSPSLT